MIDEEQVVPATADRGDDFKPVVPDPAPAAKPAEAVVDDDPDKIAALEETPEEKAEREKQEAEELKKKNLRIPKARFDEAQQKARDREARLLAEIEQLKTTQTTTTVSKALNEVRSKVDELQDKYEDLILDGKKDEARAVRKQVDALREELVEYQTTVKSDAARRGAIEELSYNAQLASLESTYTALNPDHADFNEEKTNEVAGLVSAFVKAGMPRAEALTKAAKYALGAPPDQRTSDAARTMAEARAKAAREKAATANQQQPQSAARVGLDSDRAGGNPGGSGIDVMRLSQDKFAKLDEETKATLRGDEVA